LTMAERLVVFPRAAPPVCAARDRGGEFLLRGIALSSCLYARHLPPAPRILPALPFAPSAPDAVLGEIPPGDYR